MENKKELGKFNDFSKEQKELIEAYIRTRSFVDAYREVYPGCDDVEAGTTVYYRASVAFNKRMRNEIKRRDEIAEQAERKEIERAAKEAAKKWSKADAVNSLVSLVHRCEDQINTECECGEGVNARVADTMRGTIDTLNKMLGYNEPEKQTVDSMIHVVFAGNDGDDVDENASTMEDYAE